MFHGRNKVIRADSAATRKGNQSVALWVMKPPMKPSMQSIYSTLRQLRRQVILASKDALNCCTGMCILFVWKPKKLPHDQAHSKERKLSCLGQSSCQALPKRVEPDRSHAGVQQAAPPPLYLLLFFSYGLDVHIEVLGSLADCVR